MAQGYRGRDKSFWRGTDESKNVWELMMSSWPQDSSRWNDVHLLEGACSRTHEGGAGAPCVSSNRNGDRLFNGSTAVRAMGDRSVRFKHHHQRFFQIAFGLSQRATLGIHAWNFFDITDIPLASLEIHGSELTDHRLTSSSRASLTYERVGGKSWSRRSVHPNASGEGEHGI